MKKRIAAIVLAGLLAVSVLGAGCGKNEAEDKDTQKKTEAGVDGTEKTKDRKEQTVVKPVKKPDTSGDGEQEDASPKKEEGTDAQSGAGISGQQEYNTGEEASGQVENVDSEDNTAGTDDTDDSTEEPGGPQTVTGIIQDISGSTLGIMEADGGVYGFDTGILSGFDESYQIGDTVTVTYEGDTMNPDSAEISH